MTVNETTRRMVNTLNETVAYQPDETIADSFEEVTFPEDGFPSVDDLLHQNLAHYQIEHLVGRGSMGRVYRAQHLGLDRACAIKVMNPGLVAKEPQVRDRFWAEARAVANLIHPHVVTIHNLGSDRGYHFIEMELVPGGVSLRETLVREGPLEPIRASNLVRQVVLALGAAHHQGLVHRDVKPANVLLDARGDAKLADFGLVRSQCELKHAGVPLAGTPTFMAPELFDGIPASPLSDLYAVGVMYYYLLSGLLPFTADQVGLLIQRHRDQPAPDIRQVNPAVPDVVAAVLARCLAKRPEERYQNADELSDELQTTIYHLRDTDSLVLESVAGLDCFVQGAREQFRILFPLPCNRLQEVYIEATSGKQGERLISIFSVCGPADPAHYEFALKLNARMTYGSLSVREVNGQSMFVMARTYPRDHVCPGDVRAALVEIAARSDRIEQQLTNADLY